VGEAQPDEGRQKQMSLLAFHAAVRAGRNHAGRRPIKQERRAKRRRAQAAGKPKHHKTGLCWASLSDFFHDEEKFRFRRCAHESKDGADIWHDGLNLSGQAIQKLFQFFSSLLFSNLKPMDPISHFRSPANTARDAMPQSLP